MGDTAPRSTVWLVLPAFNEEASLPDLLDRVEDAMADARLTYEVLVVDDGSTDGTAAVVRAHADSMPIRLFEHNVNMGLGASIRDGLMAASDAASPKDILVTLDADNTHTPELILRMVRMVREGHDVVIASRYRAGSRVRGVPFLRSVLSLAASFLLRVLFPIKGVKDYTSGYRAYRAAVLQDVIAREGTNFFQQGGFQVMVDILLQLRRNPELIFGEAPMILRYDLKEGASKMDIGATIRDTLRLVVRRRMKG
ncbi:MAG TPA: glycosyltransferase [Acidimicrobiia bacterium]|nr:glycosyltransferase [Acidimicrobiia bacterium]